MTDGCLHRLCPGDLVTPDHAAYARTLGNNVHVIVLEHGDSCLVVTSDTLEDGIVEVLVQGQFMWVHGRTMRSIP